MMRKPAAATSWATPIDSKGSFISTIPGLNVHIQGKLL